MRAGETEAVEPMEEAVPAGSNVIDLTRLLSESLGGHKRRTASAAPAPARKAPRKPAARKRA